jgi:hypothetical protein
MEDENRENTFLFRAHGKNFYQSVVCDHTTTNSIGICASCKKKTPEGKELEKKKRQDYYQWRKARKLVGFHCNECDQYIEGRADSTAVISFQNGIITEEKCRELLQIAHHRHAHTDYDLIRHEEYERNREEGLPWEISTGLARDTARKRISGKQD